MSTFRLLGLAAVGLALGVHAAAADGPRQRRVARPAAPPPPVVTPVVVQPDAPAVVLPAPTPVRPPTHAEFARHFQPLPGRYEVVLLHPDTRCPVQVCFTLPPGCPKKVRVERRELEFDYGRYEVEIRFDRRGGVRVTYN